MSGQIFSSEEFHEHIFSWWNKNKRDFPWRNTIDAYHITISEFMLQQTQASRVIPKYNEFLSAFPTPSDLSKSPISNVLRIWQGLGYNRRALWLRDFVDRVFSMDEFPRNPAILQKFKGIGSYTSRSIPIFAFNENLAAVDTNIRRILIHHDFVNSQAKPREFQRVAEELVPLGRSRDWHNALMDYGSLKMTSRRTGIPPKSRSAKFAGSNRQARGIVIKELTKVKTITIADLVQSFPDEEKLQVAINSLINDGLIVVRDNIARLAED